MALTAYLEQVNRLLLNPVSTEPLYTTAELTSYINTARAQVAAEGECVRFFATLDLTIDQRAYAFDDIDTGVSATNGILGVIAIRQILLNIGDGFLAMYTRPWPWFSQYKLAQVVPVTGQPNTYAQYGQGESGTIYLDPLPDDAYTITLDTVCLPIPLVNDSTVEAIPYPWTDAVPFFAAYYAYMSSQRNDDANDMYKRYEEWAQRARKLSTPGVLPYSNPQTPDPTQPNALALRATR